MIPESLNWPLNPYWLGGVVLAIGCLAGLIGLRIKSGNAEHHRDQLYVKRRRGEDVPLEDPPRVARVLEYLGAAAALVGIAVLLVAWSSTAGQN